MNSIIKSFFVFVSTSISVHGSSLSGRIIGKKDGDTITILNNTKHNKEK